MSQPASLKIALPQLTPVWMDRAGAINKCVKTINAAAKQGADLIVFSEAFIPGYPFWLSGTGGARFNDEKQKTLFAYYSDQSVNIQAGHLEPVCAALRTHKMAAYVGIVERAADRSGHSLYCAYVYIDQTGTVKSVHRKLQPTYEERLVWAPGDGAGLVTHRLGAFTVSGLNCWENWMPLTRAALYAQGEDLHIACWPGGLHNTHDITPVLAKEGRSYCVSVSALMHADLVPDDMPYSDEIKAALANTSANGGSCIAAPDGSWVLPPITNETGLRMATLDPAFVRRERQNFDPAGHYSRPDVTRLVLNQNRQSILSTTMLDETE